MTVLVAYATAHGSTRGIAERITARLGQRHLVAQARPVSEVESVVAYDGVVVGSAIHGQAWLPEAVRFMRSNATALAARPVWLFSVGMPGALARPLRRWAMREGPKALAELPKIVRPVDQHLFTGVVRREELPLVSRAILRLMGGHTGDFRDWPEIEAWADDIAARLAAMGARSG
jgi:menaquinone-dependent protoporphyrinogen oxidase